MSVEVEGLQREIDLYLSKLRETLHSTNNFNDDDRRAKLAHCQQLIRSIRTAKEAVLLEARSIVNPAERSQIQATLGDQMETFKKLVEDFEHKKSEIDRDQLQAEAETHGTYGLVGAGDPSVHAQLLTRQGDALQDQTQAAITNMRGLAIEAEEIGIATGAKMDQQTEQMANVGEKLDDVRYNTTRARQTAFAMAKSAATDLCIQILCGGILCSMIAILILVFTNK